MALKTENPFAATLRLLRGNTPQGVFAKQLGMKQAIYSHYENRRREPTLDALCRIARALDTTPNVLLGFEPPPLRASAPPREIPSVHTGDINGNGNIVGSSIKLTPPQSSSSSTHPKKGKRK